MFEMLLNMALVMLDVVVMLLGMAVSFEAMTLLLVLLFYLELQSNGAAEDVDLGCFLLRHQVMQTRR